ncbi:hypothetical protein CR205_00420 [Alteribacter lacisalsi]|uniref:DUF2642 domain-containing protein n=1 Tax=Alteribacter lacisalsi TaxID=2045244 RepID=A0A2W0H7K8_9BACI|nr:YuzF family protein [Alteribacter lacisalsi]PYZ97107.1 hypothetical protein CR205_00420 [Alteribacter lacisalsi]
MYDHDEQFYHGYDNQDDSRQEEGQIEYVVNYDPFVVETLESVTGSKLVFQTTRGNVRGKLIDVRPDHIVVEQEGGTFFIRIQEIVWILVQN